jgi:hypothetical protein
MASPVLNRRMELMIVSMISVVDYYLLNPGQPRRSIRTSTVLTKLRSVARPEKNLKVMRRTTLSGIFFME